MRSHATGPQRGFHVPHTRDTTGEDAPYTPTTTVFLQPRSRPSAAARRLPTARLLPPRYCSHPARLGVTTHHQGFTGVRPSGLPLTCSPQDGTGTLGLEPFSFAPRRYQRRTSGWGQATEHWPGTTPSTSSTSNLCVHSWCATSCRTRTPRCGRPRDAPGPPETAPHRRPVRAASRGCPASGMTYLLREIRWVRRPDQAAIV